MLQIGRERKVDAILHCGDLFHDNKPSRNTLFKTIELLRKNCIGNDECMIEYLSDARVDFDSQYDSVNFQDPNFKHLTAVFASTGITMIQLERDIYLHGIFWQPLDLSIILVVHQK